MANLYKNTQQGKKIYEFIGHDFNEDRWKKAAGRNAYQLFSQKKYPMAAAFYLLGNQINEAAQVAANHMKDIQLAITICRLMEGDTSEELKKIYKEYYIEKGKAYNDPWITSLGHWLCGDYIQSLNSISDNLTKEDKIAKNDLDIYYNIYCKEEKLRKRKLTTDWIFDSPSLTSFNPSMIVLCKKLEKHYLVFLYLPLRKLDYDCSETSKDCKT